MSDAQRLEAQRFDAYYAASRDRLLALAFAQTGDLSASRGAVRDAFVAAWHHWRKVGRLEDPDVWVRPRVWSHAQRRHSTRIWYRDRRLDPELRSTLDALAKLPVVPRRALLLTQLTSASRQQMAREVGLPLADAEIRLQTATSQFALSREVPTTAVRRLLDQLAEHCRGQQWPRSTIIRRAGTSRRRAYVLAGAALVVVALVGSGYLVTDTHGVHPTLAAAGDRLGSVPPGASSPPPSVQVTTSSLVSAGQLSRAMPDRSWRITGTDPKQVTTFPCQRSTYADPHEETALVRGFTARREAGEPEVAVVQSMELSASVAAAKAGFAAANHWFAACTVPQMQLVAVRQVRQLGDEAEQYVLRSWQHPTSTFVLGSARTGQINTLTLTRTSGTPAPDLAGNLRLLVSAVDDLCSSGAGGPCSAGPHAVPVPAPPAGSVPMMIGALDLPPVAGVDQPWVGTTVRHASDNVAATGCDRSSFSGSFHGAAWQHALTRSFLVPQSHLATSFGITETVGRLPEVEAHAFVTGVGSELTSCAHRQLGTTVVRLGGGTAWTAWQVRTKVGKQQMLTMDMGIVREEGGAVAQLGFVPDGTHTMSTADFAALVRRAGERLSAMQH